MSALCKTEVKCAQIRFKQRHRRKRGKRRQEIGMKRKQVLGVDLITKIRNRQLICDFCLSVWAVDALFEATIYYAITCVKKKLNV